MKIKKILIISLSLVLLLNQASGLVYAVPDLPDAPDLPSQPDQPDSPELPDNYQEPEQSTNEEPQAPEEPDMPENHPDYVAPSPTPVPQVSLEAVQQDPVYTNKEETGDQKANDTSDPSITTGDANSTGEVYNLGNENIATTGSGGDGNGGISILNDGNGTDTTNTGSASVVNSNDTNQGNSAKVINNLNQSAISGQNDANDNMGEVNISTGDSNVTGTALTSLNTNMAGVSVAEFNILDNYNGDYVLDFAEGCISGCDYGDIAIANTGNGSDSLNYGNVNSTTINDLDQMNNGAVVNDLTLIADSGHNDANKNTGGDINIETGDANVAANLLTFLNNNIAGGVMYGVVNVFGEMVGDIILPEDAFDTFGCTECLAGVGIANTGNGSESQNMGTANISNQENINQINSGIINNNLNMDAETGDNDASKNTGGNIGINTGSSNLDASVLNVANMNVIGENMWMVIINDNGNWIGRLYGADGFGKLAGSEGIEFAIDPDTGTINATNADNGSGSVNYANADVENVNNINQENVGTIENNLNLIANTGENSASKNTNGDVNIATGDANVLANVVNYLNNNIVGGKLLVTFVNVFGSWEGDFLTPGAEKESNDLSTQIGSMFSANASSNHNNDNSSNSNSSDDESSLLSSAQNVAPTSFVSNNNSGIRVAVMNDANENDVKVAGVQTDTQTAASRSVNINLAWFIVLLPILLAGGIITRKVYLRIKTTA